jgi:nitrous oxide reductase accessory protein NosL
MLLFCFLILGVWIAAALAEPAVVDRDDVPTRPVAAGMPLTADGKMQIGDQDRCPLCGMFPRKYPKTAAAMALADGRTFYFCGNGCMLRAWRDPATHLNAAPERIQRMVVRDFFSGDPLDAHKTWWVAGSDVVGPMGPALVALATEADLTQFKARHGGPIVFQLAQMDDALWQKLFPPKK